MKYVLVVSYTEGSLALRLPSDLQMHTHYYQSRSILQCC